MRLGRPGLRELRTFVLSFEFSLLVFNVADGAIKSSARIGPLFTQHSLFVMQKDQLDYSIKKSREVPA